MIISPDILRRDTVALLKEIDKQIDEVKAYAKSMGIEAHKLQDGNGNWVMIPLLLARTQAYTNLITLQQHK